MKQKSFLRYKEAHIKPELPAAPTISAKRLANHCLFVIFDVRRQSCYVTSFSLHCEKFKDSWIFNSQTETLIELNFSNFF